MEYTCKNPTCEAPVSEGDVEVREVVGGVEVQWDCDECGDHNLVLG